MNPGNTIKLLRKQNKMTQEELGSLLGVKKSAIQKYENGEVINLKLEVIRKLCSIFSVSPNVFIFPEADELDKKYESYKLRLEVKLLESIENIYDAKSVKLIVDFNKLNEQTKDKVIEMIEDACTFDKYTRKSST